MVNKILEYLEQYLDNIEQAIKKTGKNRVISAGLNLLIDRQSFNKDELRKDLSKYVQRIISINEFESLLDYDKIEYNLLLNS